VVKVLKTFLFKPAGVASFDLANGTCKSMPTKVVTNWNYLSTEKLLLYKNDVYIDTIDISINAANEHYFYLPAVDTKDSFSIRSIDCNVLTEIRKIVVNPADSPDKNLTIETPQNLFCGNASNVPITINNSQGQVNYNYYQNGIFIGERFSHGDGSNVLFLLNQVDTTSLFTIFAEKGGCKVKMRDSILISIDPINARFATNGINFPVNTPVIINYQGLDALSYQWDFGQDATPATSTEKNPPIINYSGQLITKIKLITSTSLGCQDTFTQSIGFYNPDNINEYWAMEMQTGIDELGNNVAVADNGDIVVNGYVKNQATIPSLVGTSENLNEGYYLKKFDKYGILQWIIKNESRNLENPSLLFDKEGNIIANYVIKWEENCYLGSTDGRRIKIKGISSFVVKWDNNGVLLWVVKSSACNGYFETKHMSLDVDGNINVLYNNLGCGVINLTDADNVSSFLSSDRDLAVKISKNGLFLGNHKLYSQVNNFSSVTLDAQKNLYFSEKNVFNFLKLSAQGIPIWTLKPTSQSDNAYFKTSGVVTDLEGNSYINGYFHGTFNFGNLVLKNNSLDEFTDQCILKVSPDGEVLWLLSPQSNGEIKSTSIALHNNDLYVGAVFNNTYFYKNLDFGLSGNEQGLVWLKIDAQTGLGKSYIAKTKQSPNILMRENQNFGNSIAISNSGDIHLVGKGFQTSWGNSFLNTPNYMFLAKIPRFTDTISLTSNEPISKNIQMFVWPNPGTSNVNSTLILKLDMNETVTVTVTDYFGNNKILLDKVALQIGENVINLEKMPMGVYFLKASTESGKNEVTKLIIHK
jgi:hypothetical protein